MRVHSWGIHFNASAYSPEPVTVKVIYKYMVLEISISSTDSLILQQAPHSTSERTFDGRLTDFPS